MSEALLSPYRVLDLTDHRGEVAGMVLGDLGADVIRVEPPEGSPARREPPFLETADGGVDDCERSLQFFAYNRNKRSIALDLGDDADRAIFEKLVASADFVLESGAPSWLSQQGFDFEALRRLSPKLVHVVVTAFGLDGPRAGAPASDLTIAALGGPLFLQGSPERPPVRVSVPQVWRHAGAEAAAAALVAHALRLRTGEAQRVDVSAQCAMTWTMLNAMTAHAIQGRDFARSGAILQIGGTALPLVHPCRDGHVVILARAPFLRVVVPWMVEEGVVPEAWLETDWGAFERAVGLGNVAEPPFDEVVAAVQRYLALHTKHELLERGLAAGISIAPVNTIPDVLGFDHLKERGYWHRDHLRDGSSVRLPGGFALAGSERLSVRRLAPRLDEHADEIRAELRRTPQPALASVGASAVARSIGAEPGEAVRAAKSPGGDRDAPSRASRGVGAPSEGLPFEGLKVADFSWIGVGPITAKCLGDHGATVVHVESQGRPDALRTVTPFKDGVPGIDRSHFFGEFNTSKLGLQLDLKNAAAIDIAKRLIAWADVCIESFKPGVMDSLGLGYEAVREINPGIVMLSTCLMGQTGSAARFAGYGYHAGAVAGFYEVTGWPDLPPDGPWMAYTDTIAPRFLSATLIAALDHRRRTGEGCHLDGAQLEMGLQFLAPEILAYQHTGEAATRDGNVSPSAVPHGSFPCAGEEQWCAIAVEDDAQWRALCAVMGGPEWAIAPGLGSLAGRLAACDEIEARLSEWTRDRDAAALEADLLGRGVPAGVVQRSSDLLRDPQYQHRGFHREHDHAEMGRVPYSGHAYRIAGYESGPRFAAPAMGQHLHEVLNGLLGLDDDAIAEAIAGGALG